MHTYTNKYTYILYITYINMGLIPSQFLKSNINSTIGKF